MIKLMKRELEFKEEFVLKYSEEEFNSIIKAFYEAIDCTKEETISLNVLNWDISIEIEKAGLVQENIDVHLSKEINNEVIEINLSYIFGIEMDELLFYSFDGASLSKPDKKVISDVEIDDDSFTEFVLEKLIEGGYIEGKAQAIAYFRDNSDIKKALKETILKEEAKKSYDAHFAVPSSTSKNNDILSKLKECGLKYTLIYETIPAYE